MYSIGMFAKSILLFASNLYRRMKYNFTVSILKQLILLEHIPCANQRCPTLLLDNQCPAKFSLNPN